MTEFLVIGLTIAICFFLVKSLRNHSKLPELPVKQPTGAPDVTVIIPARNEARQIERVVRSFSGLPVIVVDDSSSDGTAEQARMAGALVIAAPTLYAPAKGKPNACAAGARLAKTKWLLFVDADTWFEPGFAASIVSYAETNKLQMVTAFLHQHCITLAEKVVLPYAFALYFSGVSARRVNDSHSAEALANGQCILFERSAYDSIGGHGTVLNSVIEDVALARLAKRHALRLRVVRAERMGNVRMYDGLSSIWRGFEKNSFRFLLINPWSGAQVVLASILMTSWAPVLYLAYRDLPPSPAWPLLLIQTPALFLLVMPFILLAPWYGSCFVLAPAAVYLFQLIALNGMFATLTGRTSQWKGRRV
ncbi:MAG TPA: glycosyltransferase [Bryobacteraceae bacterium]|jgi:chlorobactene glucosyltransferase|nr:glycosyltransferase [Bryobacteraceae bacterium]